jgi:predicted O-methyltransferase YrrM
VTIEKKPARAELARRFIERAGLADRVDVRLGDALQVLPKLVDEGPFDAIFIDADKSWYPRYLDWSIENVRPGGLVIADNAFWEGHVLDEGSDDPDTVGIREFNRRIAGDSRFTSIVVPTRDGVAIALRNRG